MQDRGDDYTGQGRPGIYVLEPEQDEFFYMARRGGDVHVNNTRAQFPLAPLAAGTYNNSQGKTVRGQGHTIDLQRPQYFTRDVYLQHLYMSLGRSTALAFSLYRNMPMCEATGEIDWTLFEGGPPHFVADFLSRLEECCGYVGKKMLPMLRKPDYLLRFVRDLCRNVSGARIDV